MKPKIYFSDVIQTLFGLLPIQVFCKTPECIHPAIYKLTQNPLFTAFFEDLDFNTWRPYPYSEQLHQTILSLSYSRCIIALGPNFKDGFIKRKIQKDFLRTTIRIFNKEKHATLLVMAYILAELISPKEHSNTKEEIGCLEIALSSK